MALAQYILQACCLLLASACANALKPLPSLNIDPKGISISGLSSGADFAAQFSVAFSRTIMGVGIFAGEPWHCSAQRFPREHSMPFNDSKACSNQPCDGCSANETVQCDHCKSHPDIVSVEVLVDSARRMAAAGLIDDIEHLKRMRTYTYCGTQDQGHFGATVRARDFYAHFNASNVKYNFSVPSGHCWPVDRDTPVPCGGGKIFPKLLSAFPLQNCGYDGPGELLKHVYGELKPPVEMKRANLQWFNQLPFNENSTVQVGLGQVGFVYVPDACALGHRCTLHVSLHGCTNPMPLEYPEVHLLSFNRWAEANNMVVLWPHEVSHGNFKTQKRACWDSYDQTPDYDTQNGPQMKAIAAMIEAISGVQMERSPSTSLMV